MKARIFKIMAFSAVFVCIPGIADAQNDSTDVDNKQVIDKKEILYKFLFKDSTNLYSEKELGIIYSNLAIYDNAIIRNIRIRRIDLFAPSIMDTSYIPASWIERTGNSLHTNTRNKIIERNILLNPGEKIDALLLMENERIIRDLPYIMDARFLIKTIPGESDSVDVELLVKDVWPVAFGGEISDFDAGKISIWNHNMLGFGHQFATSVYWNADHAPAIGYDFSYGISNIYGSFISSYFEHINLWDKKSYLINIDRHFKTSELKYAESVSFKNVRSQNDIELIDTTLFQVDMHYTYGDLWIGRMFPIPVKTGKTMRSNIFLTGRASFTAFHNGPETNGTYLYDYQDKKQLLFSLAYSHQGFQRDHQIYTFERTEDIPFGYLLEIISGREWGQYKTRVYFSGSISAGNYLNSYHYLYGIFQYGTFFYQGAKEQEALNFRLRYISSLFENNRFRFREFVSFTYQNLMNHYEDEYVSLENRNGIYGLENHTMRGDQKALINLESVLFTPFRLLGFRFVFFTSADFGLIWKDNTKITGDNFFSGIGLGLRIRNDKLVFNTFELKFSIYPNCPEDASVNYFEAGGVPGLRMDDFYPDEPSILKFYPKW